MEIEEFEQLKLDIQKYNYFYHVKDISLISDYEFDMMMKKLKDFEEENPDLITPDSPTQHVGGWIPQ
jgi:DNA ligase (NAD+)